MGNLRKTSWELLLRRFIRLGAW